MSRERPAEPPRVVPDQAAGRSKPETPRQRASRENVERLKSGPRIMGNLMASLGGRAAPLFIRPGYEGGIIEALGEFYRGRGWRMRHCRPGATWKERQNARRGGRHQPQGTR